MPKMRRMGRNAPKLPSGELAGADCCNKKAGNTYFLTGNGIHPAISMSAAAETARTVFR